ncbi:hypothetical protein D0469_17955 [Peribacillus saganii]|uniref:Uncharacterized protein n=1 Tax=Peribacillus saganii TaxID=2303992 RepID=A0A372LFA6_9BACI|nr:hypothetical protein [Peribacillus saganii]RFU64642.1 hypothetical protein D0469_17955 [Peribacillus saganii]
MNKVALLRSLKNASRSNFFSLEIPNTIEDGKQVEELAKELVRDGNIKIRECVQREYSIYLHGIIKYASE